MLIGIAGKAGAGKDTAAEWFHEGKLDYSIVHLASPIKDALNTIFGWDSLDWEDREWKEAVNSIYGFSPRQAAQTLGTEWRNIIDPTRMMWCKILEHDVQLSGLVLDEVVVSDIRFSHEQDWVHSHGGLIIKVHRQDLAEVASHSSENSLDDSKVDFNLMNTGTIQDMHNELDRWWNFIHKEGNGAL